MIVTKLRAASGIGRMPRSTAMGRGCNLARGRHSGTEHCGGRITSIRTIPADGGTQVVTRTSRISGNISGGAVTTPLFSCIPTGPLMSQNSVGYGMTGRCGAKLRSVCPIKTGGWMAATGWQESRETVQFTTEAWIFPE